MVNGARVNKCKIQPGDQIQIGGTHDRARARGRRGGRRQPQRVPAGTQLGTARAAASSTRARRRRSSTRALAPARNAPPHAVRAPQANPFARRRSRAANRVRQPEPVRAGRRRRAFRTTRLPEPYTYTLVKSGPDVNPDEVELAHVASVEVMVLWDTNVLHVSHLTPPRTFYVGEEEGKNFSCDYFIPSGEARHDARCRSSSPIAASVSVVILPRATRHGRDPRPADDDARGRGAQRSHAAVRRALAARTRWRCPPARKARIELDGLVFQVARCNAGKPLAHGIFAASTAARSLYFGLSFLAHIGLIAAMAFFVPPHGLDRRRGASTATSST